MSIYQSAPYGNVGIGTVSPGVKLDVIGNIRQTTLPVLYFYKSTSSQSIVLGGSFITFNGNNIQSQWTIASPFSRFTLSGPTGYYHITARLQVNTACAYLGAAIRVNGVDRSVTFTHNITGNYAFAYTEVVWLLNTNDYIEVLGYPSTTVTIESSGSSESRTAIQAYYLSGTS